MAGAVDEYGWFTPADIGRLFRVIHSLGPNRVVLVGGQSLTTWVEKYKIPLPAHEGQYLTADADFQGTIADGEAIASSLGGTLRRAKMSDHTPEAAVISFEGNGGVQLNIDILLGILGVPDEDVKKLAVPVQIADYPAIYVLHPVLVLESRCANLECLSHKRNGNGITQARVACTVVQRYLEECLSDPARNREALKAARRLITLAQSSAGVFVWQTNGIDVLSPIIPTAMPGDFMKSWEHDLKEVQRKRDVAARRAERR